MKNIALIGAVTACALLLSIAGASATTLTPEQQELVRKYKISAADQKKLFGAQAVASPPATNTASPRRQAPAKNFTPVNNSPVNELLASTYVWIGGDTYKSIGDRVTNIAGGPGALSGSFGLVGGFNTSFGIGDSPIRFQVGASHGVYDFKGRLALIPNSTVRETQTFYTAGFYKRGDMSNERDPISWGVVYDVFRADNWGVNAGEIDLSQVRGTIGYALSRSTEIGLWATFQTNHDRAAVTVAGAPNTLTTIHAMNQTNFYVKQNFAFGGQLTGYAGVLDGQDIAKWQFGLVGQVPLSSHWSAFGNFNYVVANFNPGALGVGQEQFSASFGLTYYFGGNAQSASVTGNRRLPLLDVASNRTFLVTD